MRRHELGIGAISLMQMSSVEVVQQVSPSTRASIDQFLSRMAHVERPDAECERLDDHLLLDFRHGPRPGFVAALASAQNGLVGYAQASASAGGHVIDSIVAPGTAADLAPHLLAALLDALPSTAPVTWWAHDDDHAVAESLGLAPGRRLLQMRVDLPLATAVPSIATRPFRVGHDEQEWLQVNNAAFEWHGEQGGWDLATIRQREQEPWFDPNGFLVSEHDGAMAGFCWTKVHETAAGRTIGEIYVIAVHPRHRGTGLGRSLTLAGIAYLGSIGAAQCMLYVDAGNAPAVGLYTSLGFRTVHAEQAFSRGDVNHISARTPQGAPR